MAVTVTKTKELGLEVYKVYADTVHMATFLSQSGAMTLALRLKNKLESK